MMDNVINIKPSVSAQAAGILAPTTKARRRRGRDYTASDFHHHLCHVTVGAVVVDLGEIAGLTYLVEQLARAEESLARLRQALAARAS